MFTLDTNILIYYAAGEEKVVSFLSQHQNETFYLPTIVATEFLSYPLIEDETIGLFRIFLTQTIPIGLDLGLAEQAALVRRAYKLKTVDAIIAATAILTKSSLITRNIIDFKKIKELNIIEL